MRITVLTLFPGMVEPFFSSSIMKRAVEKGIIEYSIVDIRDFAEGVHRKADDIPYGGGAGMVMMAAPVAAAIKAAAQRYAEELSREDELCFICGHYEGLDQRIIDEYVTDEISIGDYVLSSGESAAVVIIDALYRLVDGVIAEESLEDESFSSGLLEYPQYTRPERYCMKSVPSVLLSGHHRHITEWRCMKRLEKTMLNRPDLLSDASLSIEERRTLLKILNNDKGTCQRWTLSEL